LQALSPRGTPNQNDLYSEKNDFELVATTAYKGIPLQKAGERFGLTSADLEELFDMREEGASGDGFMPLVQTKMTEKGRGGVLGYKAARTPTAFKTYGALEGQGDTVATGGSVGDIKIGQTVTQPAQPVQPVQPVQPATPKKLTAQDVLADFGKYDVGEKGLFGGQDVDNLRTLGLSDEDIRQVATGRSAEQPLPAAVYQRLGGVTAGEQAKATRLVDPQTFAKQFISGVTGFDAGEAGIFGGQDVDAMRTQGYSDDQIRATARALQAQGKALPPAVTRRLGSL
jgi:hypothetical protein